MTVQHELITGTVGRIGHIQLNRPKALNALTLGMVQGLRQALENWADDPQVDAVFVEGVGERAFCAGGDVKSVYFAGRSGEVGRDGTLTADFFREEYMLNFQIANFPKPYITLLDGFTMGGGAGISILAEELKRVSE